MKKLLNKQGETTSNSTLCPVHAVKCLESCWLIWSLCSSTTDTVKQHKMKREMPKMILSKDPIIKKSSPSAKKKSHRVCACPSWIHNKFQRVNECVSGLPGKASTSWKRMVKKPPTWHGNSLQADWHPRNSPNALHLHFTYSLGLGQGLTDNAKTPAFSSFISERLMGSSKCHLNANRPL